MSFQVFVGIVLLCCWGDAKATVVNTSAFITSQTYCRQQYLIEQLLERNITAISTLNSSGVIGVSLQEQVIYVVLTSATPISQLIQNPDSKLIHYSPCTNCKVNGAFLSEEEMSIHSIIKHARHIRKVYNSVGGIRVIGHGIAGAIATLVSMDLVHEGFTNVSLVTFGSPRVGNAEFAAYISDKLSSSTRVTHYQDFAPRYPNEAEYVHISGILLSL